MDICLQHDVSAFTEIVEVGFNASEIISRENVVESKLIGLLT